MNRGLIAAIVVTAGAITTPEGETVAQDKPIQTLIKQLESSDYRTREGATRALQKRYDDALEAELLKVTASDTEVRRRLDLILAPWHQKQIKVRVDKMKEACRGKFPWIDGIDCWQTQNYYMSQAGTGKDDNPPEWGKYRRATELLLMDMSKQGYELHPIVERLKERHNAWQRNNKIPPEYDK